MSDVRLIERWLPIAALSEESVRERRAASSLPPLNYLHVWWARRPLIASRAAILGSLLSSSFSHKLFLKLIGIHGDPVAARRALDSAKRRGVQLEENPYGYARAFEHSPEVQDLEGLPTQLSDIVVVDPTAGGGSIPFEALRLGFSVYANDLNPVASVILEATLRIIPRNGINLVEEFDQLSARLTKKCEERISRLYECAVPEERVDAYLWARTIKCPYCEGLVPLAPNWRLSGGGVGVQLRPNVSVGKERICEFFIVDKLDQQSQATCSDGDARCPFPGCERVIDGDEVKRQAQAGQMGDQLFAVATKRRISRPTKNGGSRLVWQRLFRAPVASDHVDQVISDGFADRLEQLTAHDCVPSEEIDVLSNYDRGHRLYGMNKWVDFFSKRQVLAHGALVESFAECLDEDRRSGEITEVKSGAYVLLSFALDKYRDYNSRQTRWHVQREVIVNTFDSHNFAMRWSYAEMAPVGSGNGLKWVIDSTRESILGILKLYNLGGDNSSKDLFKQKPTGNVGTASVTSLPGSSLVMLKDNSVDAVIMDPPYGANVMYAELSDFFYVWLKRTAGLVVPELFTRRLTDKHSEAVANKAHFKNEKGADALANRDYQEKMAAIFAESRRVLKSNGIMTVMFTHKDTSAWDALTKGLIEAGFIITASWPVNTESEGSLHIRDKAAANSTILLVCRPRPDERGDDLTYWEDVEPLVAKAVRARVEEFQKAGIIGVDLYLASFGPALEEFSRHWPLKRGTPRPEPLAKKRRKQAELFAEEFDPYAVTPEDALDAARREVKTWRLNQLTNLRGKTDLDPATSFYVLAWDAFKAPLFAYDEGLRLARAVGADLNQMIGRICEKKGSDIKLWDSATRSSKGSLGAGDGSRGMIDALQFTAHVARTKSLEAARKFLVDAELAQDQVFLNSLEAILEVLPPSKSFANVDFAGDIKAASDDFDALEKLRRLAFSESVDEPKQLKLWAEEAA
jgi:adenine-specific DNA methylase